MHPAHRGTVTAMDQLILAARDVVEAWDNHTLELDTAIRRLAEVLASGSVGTPELTAAAAR